MNAHNQITLYHYWRSSCSWRVRWALHHKNLKYVDVPINLLKDEQNSPNFRAKNPGGFVPAIGVNGQIFGESLAILEWLEETHPSPSLLPGSATDRMRIRQVCHQIVSGIQPIQNLSVLRQHSSDPAVQAAWAKHWILAGLAKVEQLISQHAGTYCFGGVVSMADLCLVPQVYNAVRFGIDMQQFPVVSRVNSNCLKLPACDASAPQHQQGAIS